MTPETYRDLIAVLGLSQVKAGRVFGVHPRTGQRWATGEQDIPTAVQIALELMILHKVDPQRYLTRPIGWDRQRRREGV